MVIGYWVIGSWVIGYWLLVIGYWLLVIGLLSYLLLNKSAGSIFSELIFRKEFKLFISP